ncbi:MAG: AMP-binding protein, partial [Acidobacteria bacterium]|nr:AMP-binding protein [Acidobacteriota bacterium]
MTQTTPIAKLQSTAPARVPLERDEPTTLVEMLERTVELHNKPDLLNYKRDGAWRSISSDEMLARARFIALSLYSLGIRHGDRVALFSENCPEWTLADAGCLFAGVIDVPIYPTLT